MTNRLSPANLVARSAAFVRSLAACAPSLTGVCIGFSCRGMAGASRLDLGSGQGSGSSHTRLQNRPRRPGASLSGWRFLHAEAWKLAEQERKEMGASWNIIMQLAIVAVLFLVVACSGAATPTLTPTLEPTMTAQPTPTPTLEPTATSAPTATLVTPPDESDHAAVKADPRFATIREKMESVEPVWTVYFHSDDWQTPGRNTLMNEVFELLKLENIVSHGGYQEISPEMVVALEPDIIIADSIESVVDNPELASLHMVQEQDHIPHHIFVLSEGNSFSGDGSHFKDAVEELAAFVYPEVFGHEEEWSQGSMDMKKSQGSTDMKKSQGSMDMKKSQGSMDMKKSQLKTHISGQGWTCVGQAYRNTLALRILCAPLTGALPH